MNKGLWREGGVAGQGTMYAVSSDTVSESVHTHRLVVPLNIVLQVFTEDRLIFFFSDEIIFDLDSPFLMPLTLKINITIN